MFGNVSSDVGKKFTVFGASEFDFINSLLCRVGLWTSSVRNLCKIKIRAYFVSARQGEGGGRQKHDCLQLCQK